MIDYADHVARLRDCFALLFFFLLATITAFVRFISFMPIWLHMGL